MAHFDIELNQERLTGILAGQPSQAGNLAGNLMGVCQCRGEILELANAYAVLLKGSVHMLVYLFGEIEMPRGYLDQILILQLAERLYGILLLRLDQGLTMIFPSELSRL